MSEHDEQAAFMEWCGWMSNGLYPELQWMYAIPNGGHRHKATAAKLKDEGVKAGVPDLHLPIPAGPYHGLWIEMKVDKRKPNDNQYAWLDALKELGHKVVVCYGSGEAIAATEAYLIMLRSG